MERIGLFGRIDSGSVKNVRLINVNISGGRYVGAIAGDILSTSISNCVVTGNVNGTQAVGGLVGSFYFAGSCSNSLFKGNVTANLSSAGGIAGWISSSSISNCDTFANIRGDSSVGGICSSAGGTSTITGCDSFSNVSCVEDRAGGICALFSGNSLDNCRAFGNISGNVSVGGILGIANGDVTNSYFLGNVTGNYLVGGLVGEVANIHEVVNSYYCINWTKINANHSVTIFGIYENQFVDWLTNGKVINIDDYYTPVGSIYEIHDVEDLQNFLPFITQQNLKLRQMSDINLSKENNFYIPAFFGDYYDGNHKLISNLTYDLCNEELGFIGYLYPDSRLFNLTLVNVSIDGYENVGGLVGNNFLGYIQNCTAFGEINVFDGSSGGLVGTNSGIIEKCNSTCNVSGYESIGGLVGSNLGLILDCYSLGNVSGEQKLGGLAGSSVFAKASNKDVRNSYYCINSSSINNDFNITHYGIYEAQFQDWLNNGMRLNIDNYLVQNLTSTNYQIKDFQDIQIALPFMYGGGESFEQEEDIEFTGEEGFFIPLFRGNEYDGMGNEIQSLNVSRKIGSLGLFGRISDNVKISNLNLNNIFLDGTERVGGIVGYNENGYSAIISNCNVTGRINADLYGGGIGGLYTGKASQCYSNVNVTGGSEIGGLFGKNSNDVDNCSSIGNVYAAEYAGGLIGLNTGDLKSCYSTGNVDIGSGDNCGGLIGSNSGIIIDCYAAGNVKGRRYVGGFIGSNRDEIYRCYSAGLVTSSSGATQSGGFIGSGGSNHATYDCFWDTQTSGWTTSNGGEGKTTNQMKSQTTFSNANWDFNSVWGIVNTVTYPYLKTHSYGKIYGNNINVSYVNVPYSVDYDSEAGLPGSVLTWKVTAPTLPWLSINSAGTLQGLPAKSTMGLHTVNITTNAGTTVLDYREFILEVNGSNRAPTINDTTIPIAYEDNVYHIHFGATDSDGIDTFTWSINSNGDWLFMESSTGNLSGFPVNSDVGEYWVNITVSDGYNGFDYKNITITVENVNDDPIIQENLVGESTKEDELYFRVFTAVDVDPTSDTITWAFRSDSTFLSIDENSGNISGTPLNEHVGEYWVEIIARDGNGGVDNLNYTLTVQNTNDPPKVIDDVSTISFDEDTEYDKLNLSTVFSDEDNDNMVFSFENPVNASITIFENGSLIITPKSNWFGDIPLIFYANDSKVRVSKEILSTVNPINDIPINNNFTLSVSTENRNNVSVKANMAFDVDNDELEYIWNMGDGKTLNGLAVNHSYEIINISKDYEIILIIFDGSDYSTICNKKINVPAVEDPIIPDDDIDDDDDDDIIVPDDDIEPDDDVVVNPDTDDDGLPDEWEMTHFGNLDQGLNDDPDGDGKSNFKEYHDGTDPTVNDNEEPVDDDTGLGSMAIFGIIGAIVLILIIIIAIVAVLIIRKKKDLDGSEASVDEIEGASIPQLDKPLVDDALTSDASDQIAEQDSPIEEPVQQSDSPQDKPVQPQQVDGQQPEQPSEGEEVPLGYEQQPLEGVSEEPTGVDNDQTPTEPVEQPPVQEESEQLSDEDLDDLENFDFEDI